MAEAAVNQQGWLALAWHGMAWLGLAWLGLARMVMLIEKHGPRKVYQVKQRFK